MLPALGQFSVIALLVEAIVCTDTEGIPDPFELIPNGLGRFMNQGNVFKTVSILNQNSVN